MEIMMLLTVILLLVHWLHVRRRMEQMEARIDALSARTPQRVEHWPIRVHPRPTERPRSFTAAPPPPMPRPSTTSDAPVMPAPVAKPAVPVDWEAVLGGNWLNKLGMLILVIGIALALGYSFTYMGPGGRVSTCLAASTALITAGMLLEARERYRTFGRGLIGGGWAALYVTVYAMHAVEAARVVADPWLAAVLLMAVAAGMVVHSLKYGSRTVSGLAYFVAFVTLAITEVNVLAITALVPLAASLLYVARRFAWRHFAVMGAVATYLTVIARGDSGAPLWQAQMVFAAFWLLFEAFDIAVGARWLMPLNAVGFLGLSLFKWDAAAPTRLWQFLAAAALAYAVSALLRVKADRWHGALTVAAGLAAGAFLLKLERPWSAAALLVEAELLYLAGIHLRAPFMRYVGSGVFALGVLVLLSWPHDGAWVAMMALTIVVAYANRLLNEEDVAYGYAGAVLAALLAYHRAPNNDPALAWLMLAAAAFGAGWRGMRDFHYQACGLAALAVLGMVFRPDEPVVSMMLAVAALYAAALALPFARPIHAVASALLALLLYRQVSSSALTVAWGAQGLVLLAAGFPLRDRTLRLCGIALFLVCIFKLFRYDLSYLETVPRIFSFIVLGLLLVGVSWLYTRFRERIARYL